MVAAHTWTECFPAVMDITTQKYDPDDKINCAIRGWFRTLSDHERIMWHQYCCHNRHGDEQREVAERLAKSMQLLINANA
jgi:hypothetical protein